MKGRKPRPTYLKIVAGNPGRRPLNQNEPKPEAAVPAVPAHLSDEAKVEWGRLASELSTLGLLTRIDRASLAAYCQAWADWVEAEEQLRKYGKLIKSPVKKLTKRKKDGTEVVEESGGYPIQSPYLAIRNRSLELMHKFAVEFGMTPSSRSRVECGNPGGAKNPQDPASKYLG